MALPAETQHGVAERDQRHRALKGASILNGVSRSAIACTIRNQSETGFGLRVPAEAPIPRDFLLWVPVDGKAWRCHLEWRRGGEAGVSFDGFEDKPRWVY